MASDVAGSTPNLYELEVVKLFCEIAVTNSRLCNKRPANNRLSHDTALVK
jgi:hypothetical protein